MSQLIKYVVLLCHLNFLSFTMEYRSKSITELIIDTAESHEKETLKKCNPLYKSDKLKEKQTEFLTFTRRLIHNANFYCMSYLLTIYKERNLFVAQNEGFADAPPFLTPSMIENVISLFKKNRKIEENQVRTLFSMVHDSSLFNKFIYKYKVLESVKNPILPLIVSTMGINIFMIDKSFFGSPNNLHTPVFFPFNFDTISPENPTIQIEFLKKAIKPHLYEPFKLSEFSGNVKKKVINFMLCLHKCESSKTRDKKLPKAVKYIILENLALHEYASRYQKHLFPDQDQHLSKEALLIVTPLKEYFSQW